MKKQIVIFIMMIFLVGACNAPRAYVTQPTGIVTDPGEDWVEVCFKVVSGGPSEFGCNRFYLPDHDYLIGDAYPRMDKMQGYYEK